MSISLDDLHILLESHCLKDNNAGFCVNIEWLKNKYQQQIRGKDFNVPIPTTIPKINVGLSFTENDFSFSEINQKIHITKFEPTVNILADSGDAYNIIKVTYSQGEIELFLASNGRIKFQPNSNPTFKLDIAVPDISLIDMNGMTLDEYQEKQNLVLQEKFLSELFAVFVRSIPFPAMERAMNTFQISAPYKFLVDSGYAIVSGKPLVTGGCSKISNNYKINEILNFEKIKDEQNPELYSGFKLSCSQSSEEIVALERSESLSTDINPMAVFLPKSGTIEILAKPSFFALSAHDSHSSFFIDWSWNGTAKPKKLSISFSTNNSIIIDVPCDIYGSAAGAVGIGCMKAGLSTTMNGTIEPNIFTLKVDGPVRMGNEVLIKCAANYNVDLKFTGPPLLDLLLDIFFDEIGKKWLVRTLNEKVSLLHFKILDLSILSDYQGKYGWKSNQSFKEKSLVIVVADNIG